MQTVYSDGFHFVFFVAVALVQEFTIWIIGHKIE